MKKSTWLICTVTSVFAISVTLVSSLSQTKIKYVSGKEGDFHMVLNSASAAVSKDNGNLHQITIKNNVFDFIGWSNEGGTLGSIKKDTYGTFQYNGMIYNRSVINGLDSLEVNFSGGDLYYVFSEFLMEDMTFPTLDSNKLTSGTPVAAPTSKAYFVIYNPSKTAVNINSIDVEYSCDASIDATMMFNKNSQLGNARSAAKRIDLTDSFIEIENNPTKTTNNYSVGSNESHAYTWYRWNGKFFRNSRTLQPNPGNDFAFGMTVVGNISKMIDENDYFHYAVWPQFSYVDTDSKIVEGSYIQTYIGNDNYEPLGKDNALNPSDPYVQQSYSGRFFSDYGWYENKWMFPNPDTTTIDDGTSTTFRQAYEAYNLPFWFIIFHVYLDTNDEPICDTFINGFKLFSNQIFDDNVYDKVNKPQIFVDRMQMHVVNYGVDVEGNPANSYTGTFTYPRLITDN